MSGAYYPATDDQSEKGAAYAVPFVTYRECNCSEPSGYMCKSVSHACMNEHFCTYIHLADTPHR